MRKILPAMFALYLMCSCAPAVRTSLKSDVRLPALDASAEVMVLDEKESVPAGAVQLGKISVKDNGLSLNCGWTTVLEKAKSGAKNAGGNLLKIDRHILPNILTSSCHQLEATIYNFNGTALRDTLSAGATERMRDVTAATAANNTAPYEKWRFTMNGGFSYLLSKISKDVPMNARKHVKGLKTGYHLSADAGYFWKENAGLGLKYSNFKSSHTSNINSYGTVTDNITTQFIGPVYYNRYYSKNRTILFLTALSAGYLDYENRGRTTQAFHIQGNTVAFGLDLSADFLLSERISLGCGLGYMSGVVKKIRRRDGNTVQTITLEKGNYEGMARLDVFAGFRYTW